MVLTFPESVKREVEENDHHRQQYGSEALDEHTDLIRLKIAGHLAGLQGRLDISEEDWQLAGVVVESSRRVRDRLRDHLMAKQRANEQINAERAARRSVTVTARTAAWHVANVAQSLPLKVRKKGTMTSRELVGSLSAKQRDYYEEAIEMALDEQWLTEEVRKTRGGESRVFVPGPKRPV